ncbi:MAG: MoxR family ATPase [Alphaproteobacteria bacterium]|nr:MoxR family ATPase [Alphaproteobacteria bacterium]
MANDAVAAVNALGTRLAEVRATIGQVFFGQDEVIDQVLIALLAGGHALVVGVPGLGKTRLVQTLGVVFGLETKRIQFTPDLMPDDILGSEVLETAEDGSRHFRFLAGPIFTQLLMADEINRASPRTQSALLQAMQERHVAVAGADRPLPSPFTVLATQNPIEQEGTYPLPEAQLDRFLLDIRVPYPDRATEAKILTMTTGTADPTASAAMTPAELLAAQHLVRQLPVGERVLEGILRLVRAGRPGEAEADERITRHLDWGPGPRAAQALMLAIRARALLQGRYAPSLDDVVALAAPALRHRIGLNYTARADGVSAEDVIGDLVRAVA